MKKISVMARIDEDILNVADEIVLKEKKHSAGRDYNRSDLINEALDYLFRVKKGIPYILRKRK